VVAGLLASLPGMSSILFLIGLIYYVFAVIGTKLFGVTNPELFGTLGKSLFTLFTVMTLEGWVDDVVKPILVKHPYAWIFFISFIVVTTFTVLNLIIGIIVNAISEEHAAADKVEHKIMHEETAPLVAEIKALRGRDRCAARGRLATQAPHLSGSLVTVSPGR
jgi:voltage-gated sodium channel